MDEPTNQPERAGRPGDQPLPLAGLGGDILQELIDRIQARQRVGLKRYGKPLQAFNGREAPRDLVEEQLDGAAYALQVAAEMHSLEAAVVALARAIKGGEVAHQVLEASLLVASAIERKQARAAAEVGPR